MSEPTTISFARGAPSLDIIPANGLQECANRAFDKDPGGTFSYGKSTGYGPLREWIATEHSVDVDHVLVTNGSMQADAFLFDVLVKPGDTVVVESPTYDRTLLDLKKKGADIVAVELEEDGIDVNQLSGLLEAGKHPKLAHIIPTFQNPAGKTLSMDKRSTLTELARNNDFLIFEDDPYTRLRFEGESVVTMQSLAPDAVVYASSFSKTVCPGIRVGYLVAPPDLISKIAKLATETYISPSMVSQSIVAEFCRSGAIDDNIEYVKPKLKARRDKLVEALTSEIPQATFTPPAGGYFLWVKLPDGVSVSELEVEATKEGVAIVKGTDFMLEGGDNAMRLAYSGVSEDEIEEGVKRLARAMDRVKAPV